MPVVDKEVAGNFFPNQMRYLASSADMLLYGGGAGGGKTHVAIYDLLGLNNPGNGMRAIDFPSYKAILLRRTLKQVQDVINRSKRIFKVWGRGKNTGAEPEYNATNKCWTFESGAKIFFGYIAKPGDEENYQGWEYQLICFEELTQWPNSYPFTFLHTRLRRVSDAPIKLGMRATCNPGGVGHQWVRAFWQISGDGAPNKFTIPVKINVGGTEKIVNQTRQFIPSLLDDNIYLDRVSYAASLNDGTKPEHLVKALRHGRWDIFDARGLIYINEMNYIQTNGHIRNVPYDPRYPVNTFWDLGIADQTAIWCHQRIDFVDYFIKFLSGESKGLRFYWNLLKQTGYTFGVHFVPHDAGHRKHNQDGIVKTIQEIMIDLGMGSVVVVPKTHTLSTAIETTRSILPKCFFDHAGCEEGITALSEYRFPIDSAGNLGTRPVHDRSSHAADGLRQFAQIYEEIDDYVADATTAANIDATPDVPHARKNHKNTRHKRWLP